MMKTLTAGAALAVLLAGAAQAQPAQSGRRGADTDGDRRVSFVEMQARHAERFARLDLNRDGAITQPEAREARVAIKAERQERRADRRERRAERSENRGERLGQMFARRDADRDGFLTQAELGQKGAERLARRDANRDGRLSLAELQARPQGVARGARAAGAKRQGGGLFARLDANRDGALTRAEFDAQLRVRFERLDSNRDGFITRDERRAARAARG
ncbi:MAG TPA: hypothetical protein VF699_01655 [Caulobacteraceae bacterium]|jgi:hypothetical protein